MTRKVNIIGAGLAGCEAAYQFLKRGYQVFLYEMRPQKMTPAHQGGDFAELVCSNSLRSNALTNAVGLLKREMELFDSLIMEAALASSLPAGSALAVDRKLFSTHIQNKLTSFDNFHLCNQEVLDLDENELTLVASGPLTSDGFYQYLQAYFGQEALNFFDAVAPIVSKDSLDMEILYRKSRYDKGEGDYLNAPMTLDQYRQFVEELSQAETVQLKDFEDHKVFEGCMPVEVMAKRGFQTLAFGPLKPVGLEQDGQKPYAVVQLRQDDVSDSLYNLVGFQTHLTFPEQKRVFRMIPGLENARFVRYGVMHRNTYLNSPLCLNQWYQSLKNPNHFFAGQLTGVEGYVESAASGLLASLYAMQYDQNKDIQTLTNESMMGAMAAYISRANPKHFQPMNANFGIMVSSAGKDKDLRSQMALDKVAAYVQLLTSLLG